MGRRPGRGILMLTAALALAAVTVVLAATRDGPELTSIQERVAAIASGLRCPECQNLSVADSPSGLAREMRREIASQLRAGRDPAEIRDYFVERYGDWILLSPRASGLGFLVWALPGLGLLAGSWVAWTVARGRRRAQERPQQVAPTTHERIEAELARLGDAE